jgi:hypothetical protein
MVKIVKLTVTLTWLMLKVTLCIILLLVSAASVVSVVGVVGADGSIVDDETLNAQNVDLLLKPPDTVPGNLVHSGDTLMFIGDSVVLYASLPNGFFGPLKTILNGHGVKDVNIKTFALPKSNTPSLHDVFDAVVKYLDSATTRGPGNTPAYHKLADTVIIQAGTDHFASDGRVEDYVGVIKLIVNEFRRRADVAKVILTSPTIIGEKYDNTNAFDMKLEEASAEVENIVESLAEGTFSTQPALTNTSFYYADLYFSMLKRLERVNYENMVQSVFTFDGRHFNARGNHFLAHEVASVLCTRCRDSWLVELSNEEDDAHVPHHARMNPNFFASHVEDTSVEASLRNEDVRIDGVRSEL